MRPFGTWTAGPHVAADLPPAVTGQRRGGALACADGETEEHRPTPPPALPARHPQGARGGQAAARQEMAATGGGPPGLPARLSGLERVGASVETSLARDRSGLGPPPGV